MQRPRTTRSALIAATLLWFLGCASKAPASPSAVRSDQDGGAGTDCEGGTGGVATMPPPSEVGSTPGTGDASMLDGSVADAGHDGGDGGDGGGAATTSGPWAQILSSGEGDAELHFGNDVAVLGDTAAIGAHDAKDGNGAATGAVYVFVRGASAWVLQQKLIAHDGADGDDFGASVAISADTLSVGAPRVGGGTGAVYVFVRSGTAWVEQQKLQASDGPDTGWFGTDVAVDANTIVVGAPRNPEKAYAAGAAYVFVRSASTWSQQQKVIADDVAENDEFGTAVCVSGETLAVGSHFDDDKGDSSGSAYVFVRKGNAWSGQQKLLASTGRSGDRFGDSISIQGDTLLIGAPLAGDQTVHPGAAYVFVEASGTWSEQQTLKASDGMDTDWFGNAVALDRDTAVIGANQDDLFRDHTGSAYVFTRNASLWTEQKQLVGMAADDDEFGDSVAVSGSVVLVGAAGGSVGPGSVYVFGI